jgi:nucleoside-diphosphate-sugar epimerase
VKEVELRACVTHLDDVYAFHEHSTNSCHEACTFSTALNLRTPSFVAFTSSTPSFQRIHINMHVFVTGAAGFIGKAAVANLLEHGHTVLGLARSDANVAVLEKLGASVHRGSLQDLDSLRAGAAQSDGVLHLGFVHDFSRFEEICRIDREAMTALAEGLEQSKGGAVGKPLIVSSGTLGLPNPGEGKKADEDTDDRRDMGPLSSRALSGDLVRQLSKDKGIRGMFVRFTPNVHGQGDQGFGVMLIKAFKEKGTSYYVEGVNPCWPGVHRDDAADLLRLMLEKGQAGKAYHAIDEEAVSLKDLANLIGRKLDIPVRGVSFAEAQKELGFLGGILAANTVVSSKKTREELDWSPKEIGYLEDVEKHYFGGDLAPHASEGTMAGASGAWKTI